MNVFDVDDFLEKNTCTIKLNGKDFVIRDVPLDIGEKMKEDPKAFLKLMLKCEDEDIADIGAGAVNAIVQFVVKNLSKSLELGEVK